MKLVNMERPKPKDTKDECKCEPIADSYYEKYPWGLRINLRDEEIIKLGIRVESFTAGGTILGQIKCVVSEVSSEQRLDENGVSKNVRRLELQITDLALVETGNFEVAFNDATQYGKAVKEPPEPEPEPQENDAFVNAFSEAASEE